MGGNVLAVLIEAFNLYERVQTNETFVFLPAWCCPAIVVAILMFTGWKGWNLVYPASRGGFGTKPRSTGITPDTGFTGYPTALSRRGEGRYLVRRECCSYSWRERSRFVGCALLLRHAKVGLVRQVARP
jgi:hypothetical protein